MKLFYVLKKYILEIIQINFITYLNDVKDEYNVYFILSEKINYEKSKLKYI